MPSHCTECGKKQTQKENKDGFKRTIDPFLKVCNECVPLPGNLMTGEGGARRRNNDDDSATDNTANGVPEEILNKTGVDLSGTDLYKIVTAAMHETNKKIDQLDKDIQNRIITLENRVKMLEKEGEKKDEDIEKLKHTVVSMQRALSSLDQDSRSMNAIISGLTEKVINIPGNQEQTPLALNDDVSKVRYVSRIMGNELSENSLDDIEIFRIGKPREGMERMIKVSFPNADARNEFVKNSSRLKTASDLWKNVYVRKDQHPVYASENNRLRKKMGTLRRDPANANKDIALKDGKLTVDGHTVDHNLFFH